MTYEIEKGIKKTNNAKYPFSIMEVGDSFYIQRTIEETNHAIALCVRASVAYFCRKNPAMKFSVICVDGGVRVWRVK